MIRVAVADSKAADALEIIKKKISVPLVADIHFNYVLALKAIDAGVDKLRINPGNIGGIEKIERVVKKASAKGIPLRIGVNAGSLESDLLKKYGRPTPEAMVESALRHIRILEGMSFYNTIVSIKASSVIDNIEANRLLAEKVNYPIHLGVTEAGTSWSGTIKSAVGIGALLSEGIGDTIRVSITGDPLKEIPIAYHILKSLGLRKKGVEIISCPTCGRCEINLSKIAEEIEKKTSQISKPLKIAVMGCVVNGPGEAKEADIGLAGGRSQCVIFKNGNVWRQVKEEDATQIMLEEINRMVNQVN